MRHLQRPAVFFVSSKISIKIFILFLEYVVFTNLILSRINYSVNNHYLARVVLEEVTLQKGTEPVPET